MVTRKTKIVCTLGPASSDANVIREMVKGGMDVARLNFSHGTHESHRKVIDIVRQEAKSIGKTVGILQDLCGPKIRLGILPTAGVMLNVDDEIAIWSREEYEEGVLPISYENIHNEVKTGESILLSDGFIELEVIRIDGEKVVCKVKNSGVVFSRKGANMPASDLTVSAFSEKDRADLLMGLEAKVDYVALSFVRSAKDLVEIKDIISKSPHKPRLIAKIEKPQGVENLDEILDSVDGVMVARGDLGVEMPLERVPVLQKKIIHAAREAGKSVITATQMLMSMVVNPRPTRGEVSDVANAIIDGTDAVMLSDESASGKYPVESCKMLDSIARETEPYIESEMYKEDMFDMSIGQSIGRAASWLALDVEAVAIVAYTKTGNTAFSVAQFRPECPILAFTPDEDTCGKLTLCWGTKAILTGEYDNTDQMFDEAKRILLERGLAKVGDKVVLTAGAPLGISGSTNLLRIMEI